MFRATILSLVLVPSIAIALDWSKASTRDPAVVNAFTVAAHRPQVKTQPVGETAWEEAACRPAKTEAEFADVPFGFHWLEGNGTVQTRPYHLIEHGCPEWVANYYRNDPNALNRIHGGYHSPQTARLMRVHKPIE